MTITETVIALVLLTVAVSGVGKFATSVKQGLKDRELSARIGWEIEGARETIGSWPVDEITQERIESIPISTSLNSGIRDARWDANVTVIEEPTKALQIRLSFVCLYHGQAATPDSLTFWVDRETHP